MKKLATCILVVFISTAFVVQETPLDCLSYLRKASDAMSKEVQAGGVEVHMKVLTVANQALGGEQEMSVVYTAGPRTSILNSDHFTQFEDALHRVIVMKEHKAVYIYDQLEALKNQALWKHQFFNEQLHIKAKLKDCSISTDGVLSMELTMPGSAEFAMIRSVRYEVDTASSRLKSTVIDYRAGHNVSSYRVDFDAFVQVDITEEQDRSALKQVLENGKLKEAFKNYELIDHRNT